MGQHWAPLGWSEASLETDEQRRRENGRIAGMLFAVGSVASVPANQLFENPPAPSYAPLVSALGFLTGVICFFVPWHRLPAAWFHVVPVVATLEVALSVASAGDHGSVYSWYYVFIAVFAAYTFRSRLAIALHVAFACLAFAAPIAYDDAGASDALVRTVVSVPVLLVGAGVVMFLRGGLEAGGQSFRELSERDPLAGVANYRTLHDRLAYEVTRHERHSRSFAVMLLDLHRFKEVNELQGHLAGDRLLKEVGRVLSETVRDQDTVARQGGDEFSVLAPETTRVEAAALADRVREALRGLVAVGRPLTASIGIAVYPDDGETPEALLARADSVARREKRDLRLTGPPPAV